MTGEIHHQIRLDPWNQRTLGSVYRNYNDEQDDDEPELDDYLNEDGQIQLPYLTSLTVCKDVGSGALEELIRLCPQLEELSWMGSTDSDLRQLTKNLRDCCRGLSVLTYSTVEINEDESVYAALIQSMPRLVELQIRIPALGNQFTEALIRHAPTLEILDLKIMNDHHLSYGNLKRILTSCHQITALSIEGSRCGADLFSFKWACLRLNRLFLKGLHSLTRGNMADPDNATIAEIFGWTATMSEATIISDHMYSIAGEGSGSGTGMENPTLDIMRPYGAVLAHKVSTGFLRKLLLHLQAMIHLQSFVLNEVEYTRQPFGLTAD